MADVPILKPREVATLLERLGFIQVRQRGSHRQFRHPNAGGTTVPFHGSREVAPIVPRKLEMSD